MDGEDVVLAVEVGGAAPDFALLDVDVESRSLSEFKGKTAVLAFFPLAFGAVCTKELRTLRDILAKFDRTKTQLIGISVDNPYSNAAFAYYNKLNFPILSDYDRVVIRQYDVLSSEIPGLKNYISAKRAIFIVDRDGIVCYKWVSDDSYREPNYGEIEGLLRRLQDARSADS